MPSPPIALTIGNFDGVHEGHRALVAAARRAAGPGGIVRALVFEPHPRAILDPRSAPIRLVTAEERNSLLLAAGVDEVVSLATDRSLLALSPEPFVSKIIHEFGPSWVVEGSDFRFGRGREGDVRVLADLLAAAGRQLIIVPPVELPLASGIIVRASSSRVRELIRRGHVRDAARLLGRAPSLEGIVERGEQRGRQLGFPTANLRVPEVQIPADGIYAGRALEAGRLGHRAAAISIGTKPSFGGTQRVVEAHLLEEGGPLDRYGYALRLEFVAWIREQIRFESLPDLVAQIDRDCKLAREILSPSRRLAVSSASPAATS